MTEAGKGGAPGAEIGAGTAAAAGAAGAAAGGVAPEKAAAAAGAGVDKAATGTIADGGAGAAADAGAEKAAAGDGKAGAAQPDWRDRMAGEDKDFRKRLERFADEGAFAKSYRALEGKLSSGEMKRALPDGASAEELATWRKENGIPDKPEGYVEKLALPEGLVIGEADKPIVAEFAKAAHESNIDPKAFSGLVAQYYKIQDAQRAAQEDGDAAFKQNSEEALRTTWQGPEFRQNLTAIQNMLAGWPEGLAARVLAGRTPDGRKLGDDPAFVQQMAQLARELNPAATLVPAGSADPTKGVADRIAEIKTWMGAKKGTPEWKRYWSDEKVRAEYRDLLDAQSKMKARA